MDLRPIAPRSLDRGTRAPILRSKHGESALENPAGYIQVRRDAGALEIRLETQVCRGKRRMDEGHAEPGIVEGIVREIEVTVELSRDLPEAARPRSIDFAAQLFAVDFEDVLCAPRNWVDGVRVAPADGQDELRVEGAVGRVEMPDALEVDADIRAFGASRGLGCRDHRGWRGSRKSRKNESGEQDGSQRSAGHSVGPRGRSTEARLSSRVPAVNPLARALRLQ